MSSCPQRSSASATIASPPGRVGRVGMLGHRLAEVMYGAAKCRAIFTAVNNRLSADIAAVLRLLVDRKVTHAVLVPTVLQRLLAMPECKTTDWSALRYVVRAS
jgi:acyl-coenzyme A synthetase/AMP-(fatty) acid ligase